MLKTYLVDGDKGGVGKTMTARVLTDALILGESIGLPNSKIICMDADRTNPDFAGENGYTTEGPIIGTGLIDLGLPKYWAELANKMEDYVKAGAAGEEIRLVVSLPATVGKDVFFTRDKTAGEVMGYLNAVPVWVMGRTKDSVTQLQKRYEAMPKQFEHGLVVMNLFFGTRDRFQVWDTSDIRAQTVGIGSWLEADLPELSDLVASRLGRTPFHVAAETGDAEGGVKLGMGDLLSIRAFRNFATSAMAIAEKVGVEK